jgi:hypothetical protein
MRVFAAALLGAFLIMQTGPCAGGAANFAGISIAGAPDHGIFDPSIASDGSGKLYMSLSGVAATVPGGSFDSLAVRTYLAMSGDQGKSWQLAGVINPETQVMLKHEAAPHRGVWQSEVSTLAFDPYAPEQSRWKLIWHQYLAINGERKFDHGWMAYKEAASPEKLAAAKPVKLFAGEAYKSEDNNPAGGLGAPIAGAPVNMAHKLAPALEHCVLLSEAGMLAKPDALYMSMLCFKPKLLGLLGAYHHVILLKCARPCEAAKPGAWSYVGTLLSPEDAEDLGVEKLSASDLFSEGGRDFLTVSPVGNKPVPDAYKGCLVFRFADLAKGRVERDAKGHPSPAVSLAMDKESFNGACAFLPAGPNKGMVIGRISFMQTGGKPDAAFHIFHSNVPVR